MKEKINEELKKYIEENILSQYDTNNVGGHGIKHIEYVIQRSFEIVEEFNLDVKKNMVYTIAAFHDIGYRKDPERHEQASSKMFRNDKNMSKFFDDNQLKIIEEAITDHRASLGYEARSVYGKIVSSADRDISVENLLKRAFLYFLDKLQKENPTTIKVVEYSYEKLLLKYGNNGYAKMYYPDRKYRKFLEEIHSLLDNKEKYIDKQMEIAKRLNLNIV